MKLLRAELGSQAELDQCLEEGSLVAMLGNGIEAPARYFVLQSMMNDEKLEIGIASDGSGSVSAELVDELFFIGHDRFVTILSLTGLEISSNNIEGAFFEFVIVSHLDLVIAIHELGMLAYSRRGELLWRHHSSDIVEDWRCVGDLMDISTIEGRHLIIDLANQGSAIQR